MSVARYITGIAGVRLALVLSLGILIAGCSSKEERAKSYYESGMKLLAAKDYGKASVEFKSAIKAKKDYTEAYLALAKLEELNKNYLGQVPYLRAATELNPNDMDNRLKLARLLVAGGAYEDALPVLNEIYAVNDHNPDARALKAAVLMRMKDSAAALKEAQAALDLDPNNAGAMAVFAADRLTNGDPKAALEFLDKAEAATDGKDVGVELFKLKIFEQIQDLQSAEVLLKKLAASYPNSAFRAQLVRLYLAEKRPDAAEKELRAIIAEKPDDTAAELGLVRLLNTFKGAEAARQELLDKIKAGKNVFQYQIALAQLDFDQGNVKDSEALLKQLIASSAPEDVQTAQLLLARIYLSRKDIDAANKIVTDVLSKDNRSVNGLELRASIHMEKGELEPAINDLREALNDQPRSTGLMLLLANAYERSGLIEPAEKEYADALRVSNFDPAIGLTYIAFLQRRSSSDRAEEVLADLAGRWPQNKDVLSKLAEVHLAHKDWAGAQAIAERIKAIGDFGIANQILGTALLAQDKYDQGIDSLQSAYAAAPTAVQPMLSLVQAYIRSNQTEKAIALLQNVLKANPADAEAYVLLGKIDESKSSDQAVKNFEAAIEKQPRSVVGYQALWNFYINQKDLAKADEVVKAGLRELPENFALRLMTATTLEMKKDYDGAIAVYESMLVNDPGSLVVVNNLASLLSDHRTDKASLERAQVLAAGLRKSPIAQFKDTLGWVTFKNDNAKDALPLLEDAVAALPNRAMVRYHLGMTYIAIGDLSKAAQQLNEALKLAGNDDELKGKIQAALKKTPA